MKHAILSPTRDEARAENCVEVELADGRTGYLTEAEYSEDELRAFESAAPEWIVRCAGSRQFLAESDSGEDAIGYYCGYFDLIPERAVFEQGRFVGIYLCTCGFRYSGRGRETFEVKDWGYPGNDPFDFVSWGAKMHVFLFEDEGTLKWRDWSLLRREPGATYESELDF